MTLLSDIAVMTAYRMLQGKCGGAGKVFIRDHAADRLFTDGRVWVNILNIQ